MLVTCHGLSLINRETRQIQRIMSKLSTHLAGEEVVEVAVQRRGGALLLGDVLDHRGVGHFLVHVRVTLSQELEPAQWKDDKTKAVMVASFVV